MQLKEYLEDEFIIWNPTLGVFDRVRLDRFEGDEDNLHAWLDEPYEMVGPFNFTELLERGEIYFVACMVLTEEKWMKDQQALRAAAHEKQRQIYEEFQNDKLKRKEAVKRLDEKRCRELLALPLEGLLEIWHIKVAYRKLAKRVHPDVGGSQKAFIELTQARDTLLAKY